MLRFFLRRVFSAILVVLSVFTLSFFIMRLAPGSPFDSDRPLPASVVANQAAVTGMAEPVVGKVDGQVTALAVKPGSTVQVGDVLMWVHQENGAVPIRATESYSVFRFVVEPGNVVEADDVVLYRQTSLWRQYITTLTSYVQFDFGTTFDSQGLRTVRENIAQTWPVSAELGLYALLIALVFGVGSGLVAGWRPNTMTDHTVMTLSMFGVSVPSIVLGPVLILVFIVWLQWLPAHGGWEVGPWHGWGQKVLPALTLGLAYAAYFARLTRGGLLEVRRQDFIRTARAKGLSERRILWKHAFRGAVVPTVGFLGPACAHLLVGSVVVETIFNIPGISKYFVESAINRDYPMVMGVVVLYSMFLVCFNLIADLAYAWLDPRVRYE